MVTAILPSASKTVCLAFILLLSKVAIASDAGMDVPATELLKRAASASDWANQSTMVVRTSTKVDRKNVEGVSETITQSSTLHIWQMGSKHLLINKTNDDGSGKLKILVTPGRRLLWNGSFISYTESLAEIKQSENLDRAMPTFGWYLNGVVGDSSLTGYPFFSLNDIASEEYKPRVVGTDVIDRLNTTIVEVKKGNALLRVWVVPERDYNFAKYTYDRPSSAPALPASVHLEVSDVKFERLDSMINHWVIVGGTRREREVTSSKAGSSTISSEIVAARSGISSLSDKEPNGGIWETAWIKNGTRVIVSVDPKSDTQNGTLSRFSSGIRYVWKDDRPIADFDPALVDKIREQVRQKAAGDQ